MVPCKPVNPTRSETIILVASREKYMTYVYKFIKNLFKDLSVIIIKPDS